MKLDLLEVASSSKYLLNLAPTAYPILSKSMPCSPIIHAPGCAHQSCAGVLFSQKPKHLRNENAAKPTDLNSNVDAIQEYEILHRTIAEL